MLSLEGVWKDFGALGWKAIERSELNGLFCGNFENENTERNADSRGLECEASERRRTLWGLFDIFD